MLKVVCRHPELDERPLPLRLHELHQMEQGHVVEQDIGHVNLKNIFIRKPFNEKILEKTYYSPFISMNSIKWNRAPRVRKVLTL